MVNQHKIDWEWLSSNSAPIDLLTANQDKIHWPSFCGSQLFTYDYAAIRADHEALHEELIAEMYHPSRIGKWLSAGNDLEDYLS